MSNTPDFYTPMDIPPPPRIHEHDWQLARLDTPDPPITLYEVASYVPPDYYATWTCHCGLVEMVKVRGEDE